MAETSRESYAGVRANLGDRQLTVLRALSAYHDLNSAWPTAYELLEWMRRWKPEFDLNNVRPRLTELRDDDLRFVRADDKRKCGVTGKRAYVWEVSARGREYLKGAR